MITEAHAEATDALLDLRTQLDVRRDACPVEHTGVGTWTLLRHADVVAAALDPESFSSAAGSHRAIPIPGWCGACCLPHRGEPLPDRVSRGSTGAAVPSAGGGDRGRTAPDLHSGRHRRVRYSVRRSYAGHMARLARRHRRGTRRVDG